MSLPGPSTDTPGNIGEAARYPRALRVLHWSLVLLFVAQFALILVLRQLQSLEFGQLILNLHRQCGSLLLLLVMVRLVLAVRLRAPLHDVPLWQRIAARAVHLSMFAALAAQPVLGLLVSWARGDSIMPFGLVEVPAVATLSTEQGVLLEACHRWLAYGLLTLVAIHIGAIFFTRLVRKTWATERMLSGGSAGRLVNRVPLAVQLCGCFGLILGLTLASGAYSARQYAAFKELRSHFDETEVSLLDDLRATQIMLLKVRSANPGADAVDAAREGAVAVRGFAGHLTDPAGRASLTDTAATLDRIAGGDSSVAAWEAVDEGLQSIIDNQYMLVFQGRLEITETAAHGHDLIVVTLAPAIVLSTVLALLLSRSILLALRRAHSLVRSVEEDRPGEAIEISGNGEFAHLMRAILRARDAVKERLRAGHAREVEMMRARDAREAEAAVHEAEILERARTREAEMALDNAAEQARFVEEIGRGLAALVAGKLQYRIATSCSGGFDQVRSDFNTAIELIEAAMTTISRSSGAIGESSQEVSRAAAELAVRSQGEAADLSHATHAVGAMTEQVRASAESALQVALAVGSASRIANESRAIVDEAIAAMHDIDAASAQIVRVVEAMEEIASHSALLALNARIEAARAGESGRGFAIVAQEVHTLAQKAGESTDEIRALVEAASRQVAAGVASVCRTGEVLHQIVHEVSGVDALVGGIASSAQEQAAGLDRINRTMEKVDRTVRTNSGLVQQTNAALEEIRESAARLDELIKRVVGGQGGTAAPGADLNQIAA